MVLRDEETLETVRWPFAYLWWEGRLAVNFAVGWMEENRDWKIDSKYILILCINNNQNTILH